MAARDTITIRWTPPDARPRRLVFEPRDAGGWLRREEVWRDVDGEGPRWTVTGEEIVSNVGLEAPAAIIPRPASKTWRGP
ncbi:hypothetical protein [Salinilacihabitans rarus]|uniref:hypothetical protein n=1 Tax=Salinilacihabitans rarus TaxID=2961596 RepID=UPI0020C8E1C0|nr:hypothetical protein [Salinilacihabitans rarus]